VINCSLSYFGNVRLIRKCAIIQIIAILMIYRNDLLNCEQAAATHITVTAQRNGYWVMSSFAGKEPTDKRRVDY